MRESKRPMDMQALGEGPVDAGAEVDEVLIQRVQRGETDAFSELVRRYQDRVYNTCWRLCGHLEDARDLTQEAFLKAFQALDRFRNQSGFYTWIFRIAVNLAISHRRSAARRDAARVSLETLERTQAEGLSRRFQEEAAGQTADGRAGDAELLGRVAHALHEVEQEHRVVLVLRDIEGLDYQQIADILQVPAGTVKSRLHRARVALRDALERKE